MDFLSHYGLSEHFALNIEPNHTTLAGHDYEHDLMMSSKYGMSQPGLQVISIGAHEVLRIPDNFAPRVRHARLG